MPCLWRTQPVRNALPRGQALTSMETLPLPHLPDRGVRRCARCDTPVPVGPLHRGLGVGCARMLGLIAPSPRLRSQGQGGPDLLDQLNPQGDNMATPTIGVLIEPLAEAVHDQWMESKLAQGVTSRRSETGEELMVPYRRLSQPQKDLDRNSVRAVLDAAGQLGYTLTAREG
jgi:hypothetical protein